MADDHIQTPPDHREPARPTGIQAGAPAAPATAVTATPEPARPGQPAAGTAGQGGATGMLVSWLKFLGVGLVVAFATGFCLRFFLDLDTRRVLGLSAIAAVVGTAVARAWLRPAPARTAKTATEQHTQSTPREVVETVVFVVVLVLLLKSFAAEAFVIPTGS